MTSTSKKSTLTAASNSPLSINTPQNDDRPIRIALLGGAKSGKTSIISKLSLGGFRDTYYPTHQTQPILFHFIPQSILSRCILDERDVTNTLGYISQHRPRLIVSPVIYQAYSKLSQSSSKEIHKKHEPINNVIVNSSNQYYTTYRSSSTSSSSYVPPEVSPILVELIDTAAFNPDQVVPFLEASLYIKLDREILKNLANEPRRPVSTNPLLVASGASELNGSVDGYLFVYSAIPSYNPPSYNEIFESAPSTNDDSMTRGTSFESQESHESQNPNKSYESLDGSTKTLTITNSPGDTTFNLLSIMKVALNEAWKEYNNYKTRWEQGKESDIFSFKSALKSLWNEKNLSQIEATRNEIRQNVTKLKLIDNSIDPADPSCPPPIWIVCTHTLSHLASPKLIEDGMKLSKFWKCGFIDIDVSNDNIDESLALIIREILERKKLQSKSGKKKKF